MRREEKIFIAKYKCRCCGKWIEQNLYVPKQVYGKDTALWEMYHYLERAVPKTRLDDCQCTTRGRTVQELLCIIEKEDQ